MRLLRGSGDEGATPTRTLHAATPAGRRPPRRVLVFAIVGFALFIATVDTTIVATALAAIQHDLDAPINWSGWTITIYALGQLVAMPLSGKLSDQYGRKKVFLTSAVVFVVAAFCCSLAPNIQTLIAFRAVQALGGGAFMPSATGIVVDQFGRERDRALGLFASILPIGSATGPIIGGLVVTYWSWRGVFVVDAALGALLIVLGLIFIPRSEPRTTARPDVPGILLLALSILAAMYGVTSLGDVHRGVLSPHFLVAEAVAVLAGALFVWHTRRAAAPFIPMVLLRGKGFGVTNVINLLYGAATLGLVALIPLYANRRFGIQVLEAGILLTVQAVGTICVAGLAVLVIRRTGYRKPIFTGLLVIAVGLLVLSLGATVLPPYLCLALAAGVIGIGQGVAVPATNNASLQLAPDQAAAIAGLRGLFRQSGSIIAVSVTTAILARSDEPGLALAYVFAAVAVTLAGILPFVRLVPEYRGRW
ncbi:MAG: MFS transporter [Streptosporangiales bacterium]|nr:MFS transporter [Streptosporangiales bacterium]